MNGKSRIFEVLPSAARTATGNHELAGIPGDWDEIVAYLNVTAAAGTSPTLDVTYEVTPDGGTTWYTHSSFTQAIAATSQRLAFTSPVGIEGRILYTIAGTSPSFTFTLHLECKRNS